MSTPTADWSTSASRGLIYPLESLRRAMEILQQVQDPTNSQDRRRERAESAARRIGCASDDVSGIDRTGSFDPVRDEFVEAADELLVVADGIIEDL